MDIKKMYDYDCLYLDDKIWYEKIYRYLNFVTEKRGAYGMDFKYTKFILLIIEEGLSLQKIPMYTK
jgi:hypothetical protein